MRTLLSFSLAFKKFLLKNKDDHFLFCPPEILKIIFPEDNEFSFRSLIFPILRFVLIHGIAGTSEPAAGTKIAAHREHVHIPEGPKVADFILLLL